ncbi:MAG: hypothetical protein ACFE8M_06710 [Candidatus Hermodarchaeota archaeon]
MTHRNKKFKRLFFVGLFVFLIILTSIQIYPNNLYKDQPDQSNTIYNQEENFPSSSNGYLSDYYIADSGDPQDVRIYATNDSNAIDNVQYFEIPSLSDTNTAYLSYGSFNFTFQNNYTTDYTLENTNALDARNFIDFDYESDKSSITENKGNIHPGDLPVDFDDLVDDNPNTYIRFNASNGIINFTVAVNFTGASFLSGSPSIYLNFNRTFILGLINSFTLRSTLDTHLTLKMFDISDSTWKNVTKPIFINSSFQDFEKKLINQNLNFIDHSNVNYLQFYFERSTAEEYIVYLAELDIFATYGFDLEITNNNYIALEFDLKGKKSTVNGFYAWIRTLNVSLAASTELNITLYEANATIVRTQSNLRTNNIKPNYNRMIDSIVILGYNEDNLTYFKFNKANTLDLKLYNYFIVIKSNRPEKVYSLVTIPRFTFGDPDNYVDHQLRVSNNGQDWNIARKTIPSLFPYVSERLDATSFKINVTRGYMPSDFWNSEDDNLHIQNVTIKDQEDRSAPYNVSSYLTWGLGQWKNDFIIPLSAIPPNKFRVDLNWNKTITKGFKFNVTYSVKAYWIESTTTFYNVSYDSLPEWSLSFDFSLTHTNFDDWNFLEFWFVYPSAYDAHNLTNPIGDELYYKTEGESTDIYKLVYDKTIVNKTLVDVNSGNYTLKLSSPNLIYEMHSFINYGGTFWETNGFMFGDDMTASVDIRDINGNPPKSGDANVILFYPENPGGEYPGGERDDLTGVIKDDVLRYDFNNDTLLQIRNTLTYFGNYYLGFFWTNGSAIGCKKLKLYIDFYNVEMDDCVYYPTLNQNVLNGTVDEVYTDYSILIGTVNATDRPNYYPVQNYDINQEFKFEIGNIEIPIIMNHFLQNETILNSDESVKVNVSLQNMFELTDIEVKVKVQLVSLANEDWIIDEAISSYKTLKLKGDPLGLDTQEYILNLNIPHLENDGIWQGINAPVRKGGVVTKVIIFIKYGNEDVEMGIYKSQNYALIVNSTQNDFEGYIISLKYDKEITGSNILTPFERDGCIYLPNQTTFVVNIFDENYVSSYNDFIASFMLKENSMFSNITINPATPIRGQTFNLSAFLTTEFGEKIPYQNITLQYFDDGSWERISSQNSSSEGKINFEIDTLTLNEEDQLLFRLSWLGDIYTLSNSQNITVDLYREINELRILISKNVPLIYRNRKATMSINILNTGDSQLYIPASNISIITQPTMTSRIVGINYLELNQLRPNESTTIIVEIDVSAMNQIIFNVSIDAHNILTGENLTFLASATFKVFDVPVIEYINSVLTFIIISVIVLFWLVIYVFVRRLIKRIETPVEEPIKKKRRRGKYVKVTEIKKTPKKEKEVTEKTDFDSLLEEEGLKEKKKK